MHSRLWFAARRSAPWLFAAGVLTACGVPYRGGPSKEEMAAAEYGSRPTAVQALVLQDARARYDGVLTVQVGEPVRGWYGELGGLTSRRDVRFGWAVPFRAFRVGVTSLREVAAEGFYYFRNGEIEGVTNEGEFEFVRARKKS